MRKKSKKDLTNHYHFHHEHGYDIEDCLALKKEIEVLIWQGYLWIYVNQSKDPEIPN